MYIQIKNNNPKFSYVISKNPNTNMLLKKMKRGVNFSWYSDNNIYNIYFKDSENMSSYTKENSIEYLSNKKYTSILWTLNILTEYFKDNLKKCKEEDIESDIEILISGAELRYINLFKKYFKDFNITFEKQIENFYFNIKISKKTTLYEMFNFINLFFFINLLFTEEKYLIYIDENVIEKYIKSFQVINSPYFIKYLFKTHYLTKRKLFDKYKNYLNSNNEYFIYGNTQQQRIDFVINNLPLDKPILEIGCGEGQYLFKLAPKVKEYYAIDINNNILKNIEKKLNQRNIENVLLNNKIENIEINEQIDILLVEVIEHMEQNEAKKLIEYVLNNFKFEHFIITTPNKDFNKYYELEGFRHDDHKWEMSKLDFQKWLVSLIDKEKYKLEFIEIGDKVNNITPSMGYIIKTI